MLVRLLAIAAVLYGAVVAVAYCAQSRMLFPTGSVRPAGTLPPTSERLAISLPSGDVLRGLYIPPVAPRPGRLVLLGFGGNGWNADGMATYLHELYPAAEVVTFHYRGYAPSEGRPSAAALVADAPLVLDYARARFGDAPIVAVGFSIGSGVAATLAARRPLAGAILVTPFDSLAAVAAAHFPWLPVRLLWRNRLEPAAEIRAVRIPIAIIAAGNDTLIPAARTQALQRAVPNLAYARSIAGVDHNSIYQEPAFREAMRDALARVLPRRAVNREP